MSKLLSFRILGSLLLGASCSSSSSGPVGGAVSGLQDAHCTVGGVTKKQVIGECLPSGALSSSLGGAGGTGAAGGAGGAGDNGAGGAGRDDGGGEEEAAVLYNNSGDDDDCKYHVSWTSTPVRENEGVTFTVKVTRLTDDQPATGMNIIPDVTLDASHITPSSNIAFSETPAGSGIYKVGPILFDRPGQWVVRFHFNGLCSDIPEDSPHGHIAFYLSVP